MKTRFAISGILAVLMAGAATHAAEPATSLKFTFGAARTVPGYTTVEATDIYQKGAKPYGFEEGAALTEVGRPAEDPRERGFVTSRKPFYFSAAVPEGNYRVTLQVGDTEGPTDLTVKAELRRLMVEHKHLDAGKFDQVSFVVNVRVPQYPGGEGAGAGAVRLKGARESVEEAWAWDEKLTLEFNGAHPNLCAMEIEKVDVPTVYLLGDSTMCDQSKEPWNSWGQMFTRFFKDDIAIANHAESGETVASSLAAHRFDKVWSLMKPGDYLMFAYGHNDMKQPNIERYKSDYRRVIEQTRAKGGIPVVISSMERKAGVKADTLQGYPDAARQVAEEEKAAFIDLHAMSKELYRGLDGDLDAAFQDGTHNNNFGSYEISKLVLEGVRKNLPDLARHIREDVPVFDPSHPDKPGDFKVPASPNFTNTKPLGD